MRLGAFLLLGLALMVPSRARADTTWVAAGAVSGEWTASQSPYMIHQGSVSVDSGSTLWIQPGVTVYFTDIYRFEVRGVLRALGVLGDSIRFTTDLTQNPTGWWGLRFLNASDSSRLEYCVIEKGHAAGGGVNRYGGGIEIQSCAPRIEHCTIRNNLALLDGGGIYCRDESSPVISDCAIYDNLSYGTQGAGGAGIMARNSNVLLIHCWIANNVAVGYGGGALARQFSTLELRDCAVIGNSAASGGGIYGLNFSTVITGERCNIAQNVAADYGGGVMSENADLALTNCRILNDSAAMGGGVFAIQDSSVVIRHCTFSGNSAGTGAAVYLSQMPAPATQSLLENNIVAFSSGGSALFSDSPYWLIRHCDLASNSGGDFSGNTPYGVGWVDTVNFNGTPCDRWGNFLLDPLFVNDEDSDVHLSAGSPCIAAGRGSNVTDDGDGNPRANPEDSQPDIGAYESELGGATLYACGGDLRGEIGPGDVIVACDVEIPPGDTLIVHPGTRFLFAGPFVMNIHGILLANGSAADSIYFTRYYDADSLNWRGLRFFLNGSDFSWLRYCVIEHVSNANFNGSTPSGAVYVWGGPNGPHFSHCDFRLNHADQAGAALVCDVGNALLDSCVLHHNSAGTNGAAVYVDNGHVSLSYCEVFANTAFRGAAVYSSNAWGQTGLGHCRIYANNATEGGAIFSLSSSLYLHDCVVEQNTASLRGGGLYASGGWLDSCTVRQNTAQFGGGVYYVSGGGGFRHTVIAQNTAQSGGGIYCLNSSPDIINCTLLENTASPGGNLTCDDAAPRINSSIIAHTADAGIYFTDNSANTRILFSDFYANAGGDLTYQENNPAHGPDSMFTPVQVNRNGDSCDAFYNIRLNPDFVDRANADYHLREHSPCVNAGDRDLGRDPDGTMTEIGAFPYHFAATQPDSFDLLSPADHSAVESRQVIFCWETAYDPDSGDVVTYIIYFATVDSGFFWEVGVDTCTIVDLQQFLPLHADTVWWYVAARCIYPDATRISESQWNFYWNPPVSAEVPPGALPREFALHDIYPNPFNAQTTIRYDVPFAARVQLDVFDVLGRRVAVLVDEVQDAGVHSASLNASQIGSGIYFVHLAAGPFAATQKLILLK